MPPQICDDPVTQAEAEVIVESSLVAAMANADSSAGSSGSVLAAASQLLHGASSSSLQQATYNRKKIALLALLVGLSVVAILFSSFYIFHKGFRRTIQFWGQVGPWIVQYHIIKFHFFYVLHNKRLNWLLGHNSSHHTSAKAEAELALDWQNRSESYHRAIAPKAVEMVAKMGGIYVKIGQALSTMGSGILPEEYVQALRPLQDGIPPRDYATMAAIIETSTGKTMEDMFVWFEEKPVGAATIAQAHRAILRNAHPREQSAVEDGESANKATMPTKHARPDQDDEMVIVKVQYPEVAELFDADLHNLELLAQIVMPGRSHDQLKNTRARHERELDFTEEAAHLEECGKNMVKHGLQPRYVRIPRVRNETGLCNKNVLVMEYLDGISLRDIMSNEQDRIARALGKKNGEELQFSIAKRIKEHFENGGGDADGGAQMRLLGIGHERDLKMSRLWNALGPFAIHGLRHYAHLRERIVRITQSKRRRNISTAESRQKQSTKIQKVNLGRVLKTLIHATGTQILRDGVYNLDPHPGNVLVLRDGQTVGLLDYGMVGRITDQERIDIASTIIALARNDPSAVAKLYLEAGYHIELDKEIVTDPNVLVRMASSHMDRIDLSPITLTVRDDANSTQGNRNRSHASKSKRVSFLELVHAIDVFHVPDFLVKVRQVGRLLMGVSAQSARPISLAKEWEPIAKQVLQEYSSRD